MRDKKTRAELRALGAAYQAAEHYNKCPQPKDAANIPNKILTQFSKEEFYAGSKVHEGRKPNEIASSLIRFISKL